jgi:hypothetical protein
VALWLVVAYPASSGPAAYVVERNQVSIYYLDVYRPVIATCRLWRPAMRVYAGYENWWFALGARHRRAASD